LQTTWIEHGIVSNREALLLRFAKIQPAFGRFSNRLSFFFFQKKPRSPPLYSLPTQNSCVSLQGGPTLQSLSATPSAVCSGGSWEHVRENLQLKGPEACDTYWLPDWNVYTSVQGGTYFILHVQCTGSVECACPVESTSNGCRAAPALSKLPRMMSQKIHRSTLQKESLDVCSRSTFAVARRLLFMVIHTGGRAD
jgi:hypothetical protein